MRPPGTHSGREPFHPERRDQVKQWFSAGASERWGCGEKASGTEYLGWNPALQREESLGKAQNRGEAPVLSDLHLGRLSCLPLAKPNQLGHLLGLPRAGSSEEGYGQRCVKKNLHTPLLISFQSMYVGQFSGLARVSVPRSFKLL